MPVIQPKTRLPRFSPIHPKASPGGKEWNELVDKLNDMALSVERVSVGGGSVTVTNTKAAAGSGGSASSSGIKIESSDLAEVFSGITEIEFSAGSFILTYLGSGRVRVDPNERSDHVPYATIGSKTVTFNLNGVATPFTDTNYSLVPIMTMANGSVGFAAVSARTVDGFTVQVYQANSTLDYVAKYIT